MFGSLRKLFRWLLRDTSINSPGQLPRFVREENSLFPRLYNVALEDRRVLSGDSFLLDSNAILHVTAGQNANDGVADSFRLSRETTSSSDTIVVNVNQQQAWEGSSSTIRGIVVHGSSDRDWISIDPSIGLDSGVVVRGGDSPAGSKSAIIGDTVVFESSNKSFSAAVESDADGLVSTFREHATQQTSRIATYGVEYIVDKTNSATRELRMSGHANWTLQNADPSMHHNLGIPNDPSVPAYLQWSNSESSILFSSSFQSLQLATYESSEANGPIKLTLLDASLRQISDVRLSMSSSDTLEMRGTIETSSLFNARAGQIQIDGSLTGVGRQLSFEAIDQLNLSSVASISNSDGTVAMTSRNLNLEGVVNVGGRGRIDLYANAEGTLAVLGFLGAVGDLYQTGGVINLRGDTIRIEDSARLDASGGLGGGYITVGGDLYGRTGLLPNSRYVEIGTQRINNNERSSPIISADAIRQGNGGTVVIWSEEHTSIYGNRVLSARGGELSGNGGTIETSSRGTINMDNPIEIVAPNGLGGHWIIDPADIRIVATSQANTATTTFVTASSIAQTVASGNNITIATVGTAAGNGDITVEANISTATETGPGGGRVVFNAFGKFSILSGISITGVADRRFGVEIVAAEIDTSQGSISGVNFVKATAAGKMTVGSVSTTTGLNNTDSKAIELNGNVISIIEPLISSTGHIAITSSGASPTIDLNANITTTGGDVNFSGGGKLFVNGNNRTIQTAGGDVDIIDVDSIDSNSANSSFSINTSSTTSGNVSLARVVRAINGLQGLTINTSSSTGQAGSVELGDVDMSAAGSTLTVNVSGGSAPSNGQLTIDDRTANSDSVISIGGSVNFSSVRIALADNLSLSILGDANSLSLGNVVNANSLQARNLSLSSEAGMTLSGPININSGAFAITIDADNDSTSTLTIQAPASIDAGSISISGSAANNDVANLEGVLKASAGSVTFSNFSKITFNENVTAGTTLSANNISQQINVGKNVILLASNGDLDLDAIPEIILTGPNSTSVSLTARGAGSVVLSKISSLNNVNLNIYSDRSVSTTGGIAIAGGGLNVDFSQAGNASRSATFKSINAGSVLISGSNQPGDQIVLDEAVVASLSGIALQAASSIVRGNLTTQGGAITISGGGVRFAGVRTLQSSSTTGTGGKIDLRGSVSIDGTGTAPASLTIDSRGKLGGGEVLLSDVVSSDRGINQLTINTGATSTGTNGDVTLANVRLVRNGLTSASLQINSSLTTSPTIKINGTIDLSESTAGSKAGSVDLGTSVVRTADGTPASILTIRTNHTSSAANSDAGSIKLGSVLSTGSPAYFDSVELNAGVASAANTAGLISFTNAAPYTIRVDGIAADQNDVGIRIAGRIDLLLGANTTTLTLESLAQTAPNNNTRAVDVSRADFQGNGRVVIRTSGSATTPTAAEAGNVFMGDIDLSGTTGTNELTIDTRGLVSSGVTIVDDNDGALSATRIDVNGTIEFSSTKLNLVEATEIVASGDKGDIFVGGLAAQSGQTPSSLRLIADRDIRVTNGIALPSADVVIEFDQDDTGAVELSVTGTTTAASLTVSGNPPPGNDDDVSWTGAITTKVGGIQWNNLRKMTWNDNVSSAGGITFSNMTGNLTVAGGVQISSVDSIDFSNIIQVNLSGVSGTTVTISSTGPTSSVTLGKLVATGNSNLTINSQNDLLTNQSIDLGTGKLSVDFGGANQGTARLKISNAITAGAFDISGGTTAGDTVEINTNLVASNGAVSISSADIVLAANIQTSGGAIEMSGGRLLVDGKSPRSLVTGGPTAKIANGGKVDLSGLVSIDGISSPATLTINTSGATTGGNVALANVINALQGLNQLNITSAPTTGTVVQLANIRLVANGNIAAALNVNTTSTTGSSIVASGDIDLTESAAGKAGGTVNLGSSQVSPLSSTSKFRILTGNTSGSNTVGSNGGDITLGRIVQSTTNEFFDSVELDAGGSTASNVKGKIVFNTGSTSIPASISVDGTPADQNSVGLRLVGQVDLRQGGLPQILTLESLPASGSFDSQAIDLSRADFINGMGRLTIRTSGSGASQKAGNVFLGNVDFSNLTQASSILIDTRGLGSNGLLIIQDGDTPLAASTVTVNGAIDTSNATISLVSDATLRTLGNGSLKLGAILEPVLNPATTLNLRSDDGIQLTGVVNTPSVDIIVRIDSNDNSASSFTNSQSITSKSFVLSGSPAAGVSNNDSATISGSITTTGTISLTNLQSINIQADLDARSVQGITLSGSGTVTLRANLLTSGGDVSINTPSLLIDGAAPRTIRTADASTADGGNVELGSVTKLDGIGQAATLFIRTSGTASGGDAKLGNIVATSAGINRLDIDTFVNGGTQGTVQLADVRLVGIVGTPSKLQVNVGHDLVGGPSKIFANGTIDLSESVTGRQGGTVNFSKSTVVPTSPGSKLTISTRHSGSNGTTDGSNGGNILLLAIAANATDLFDSVNLNASAADSKDVSGSIDYSAASSVTLSTDGVAGTQSTSTLSLSGKLILPSDASGLILATIKNGNNTGAIDLSNATIIGAGSVVLDTSDSNTASNAGNIVLGDVDLSSANSQLTIATAGLNTAGKLIIKDGDGNTTETIVRILGSIDFRNAAVDLGDNVRLISLGDGNGILLGTVNRELAATSAGLTLESEASVSLQGGVNLNGSAVNVSIDTNSNNNLDAGNNPTASFTSTSAINAGSFTLTGTNANESAVFNGKLTTNAGAINISNLHSLQLRGGLSSSSDIAVSDISNGVQLFGGTSIQANGSIAMNSNVSSVTLSGAAFTTVTIDATGALSSISLPNVSSVNGLDLVLGADRSVILGSVNLFTGDLQITFSRVSNSGSAANLQATDAGSVSITGGSRTTDQVLLSGSLTTSQPAGVSITKMGTTTVQSSIVTGGGSLTIQGERLLFDGGANQKLDTSFAGAGSGGNILIDTVSVDATPGTITVDIDSRSGSQGGSVSLPNIIATQGGLNGLRINTTGSNLGSDGQVTLRNIRLVSKTGLSPFLEVNSSDSTPSTVLVEGLVDLSVSALGISGGRIDFGGSLLAPINANGTLSMTVANTNTQIGNDGSDGGQIRFGGTTNNLGRIFDSVILDAGVADRLDQAGVIIFGIGSDSVVSVDGNAPSQDTAGIRLIGLVTPPSGTRLSLQTLGSTATRAIDLSRASISGIRELNLDTSNLGTTQTAGHILFGDLDLSAIASSLVVNTRGANLSGQLQIDDGDNNASATQIQVQGFVDLSQSELLLRDNLRIDTIGNTGSVTLGRVLSDIARSLTVVAANNITVNAAIQLNGGNLSLGVDHDNNQSSLLSIVGDINAGSVQLLGSSAVPDGLTLSGNVTTTAGPIRIDSFQNAALTGNLLSSSELSVSNITSELSLGNNISITGQGFVNLGNNVNNIRLANALGSNVVIESTGINGSIALATISDNGVVGGLTLRSDGGVTLNPISASATNLDLQFSRGVNVPGSNLFVFGNSLRSLSIQGGSKPADLVVFSGLQQLGTGGLSLTNVGASVWNNSINSGGAILVSNVSGGVSIADSVNVDATGGVAISSGVAFIDLVGNTGSNNRIRSQGDAGGVSLANIQSTNAVNLSIQSDRDLTTNAIQLAGNSNLEVQIDTNNNDVGGSWTTGSVLAGAVQATGSAAVNDDATLNGPITTTAGSIQLSRFRNVVFVGAVQSATEISVTNVGNQVRFSGAGSVVSNNGNVDIQTNVNRLVIQQNSLLNITANGGDASLAAVSPTTGTASLQVNAERNVSLVSTSNLNSLTVAAGINNSPLGSIHATQTLAANSINLSAASGIGSIQRLATASTNIQATNRLSDDIDISNTSASTATVGMRNLGIGRISFSQAGGGALNIIEARTASAPFPVPNTTDIFVQNTVGDVRISGVGVSAGNLGTIGVTTVTSGSIFASTAVGVLGGQIDFNSAQRIDTDINGLLSAARINLNARTGISVANAQTPFLTAANLSGGIDITNSDSSNSLVDLVNSSNGGVEYSQTQGNATILRADSLGAGAGDIDLIAQNGSLSIAGSVRNEGLTANNGNIFLGASRDVVLSPGSSVVTRATNSLVEIDANGRFLLQPNSEIRVGTSDAATEARLSQVPIPLFVSSVLNSAGVNVDADGNTTLLISLGVPGAAVFDKNFSVTVFWGDGSSDTIPNSLLSGVPGRIDADGSVIALNHTYLLNPNAIDPTAPIPISVIARSDTLNRIRVNENLGPSTQLQVNTSTQLLVPASGLFTLRLELAEVPQVMRSVIQAAEVVEQPGRVVQESSKGTEFSPSATQSVSKQGRSYSIRIVTPKDDFGSVDMSDPIQLDEEDLDDWSQLFSKLPDNRYRIFVTYESGIEVLLRDFYLKNGVPVEIDDSITPSNQTTSESSNGTQEESGEKAVEQTQDQARLEHGSASQTEINSDQDTNSLLHSLSAAVGWKSLRKAARRLRSRA